VLLGHWIEMRSISQAHGALQELAKLLASTVIVAINAQLLRRAIL
jgi:P-type Cu2+ transporter